MSLSVATQQQHPDMTTECIFITDYIRNA